MPIAKEILNMLDLGRKAIASNFLRFFCIENTKIAKDKCSHCAMALDYCFRWLLTAPSQRIIAQWVHPFKGIRVHVQQKWKPHLVAFGSGNNKRQVSCQESCVVSGYQV